MKKQMVSHGALLTVAAFFAIVQPLQAAVDCNNVKTLSTVNPNSTGSASVDGINGVTSFTVDADPGECGANQFHFIFVAHGCAPATISCTVTSPNEAELCELRPSDPDPSSNYLLGGNFPVGTNTVDCAVTLDTCGCVNCAKATFTVIVQDKQPPVVSVPAVAGAEDDPNQCCATVDYSNQVSVSDNCPGLGCNTCTGPTLNCNPPPGTCFSNGTTTVTCVGRDAAGNTTTKTFPVVVTDQQPPILVGCVDQAVVPTTMTVSNGCFGACRIVIPSNFNGTPIAQGRYIWFNSVMKVSGIPSSGATISFRNATITFTANNVTNNLMVPDAVITFDPNATTATTTFDGTKWITVTPTGLGGNTFVAGLTFQVPPNFPTGLNPVTWSADVTANAAVCVNYQWAAAVYTSFSPAPNYNALGVKPVDDNSASQYHNSDHAGTPENFKSFVTGGARGGGGSNFTGSYSATKSCCPQSIPCNCSGSVLFSKPTATDNCDSNVVVTCTARDTGLPVEPGDSLGVGCHRLDCTAVDSSGNTNGIPCSFLVCVLSPLQVVFDNPKDDNQADNFTTDCADLSAAQIINQFNSGDKILHKIRLIDCNGADVTTSVQNSVRVFLNVQELQGSYQTMGAFPVVPGTATGDSGGQMTYVNGTFQYNLNTAGYEMHTVNNNRFFRGCVRVEDATSFPGTVLGNEDVILESK